MTMGWTSIPSGGAEGGRGNRNTPSYATETGITANLMGHLAHMHTLLPLSFGVAFCLGLFLERMLLQNISHENELIFKRMNVQVTCIFIRIVLHK